MAYYSACTFRTLGSVGTNQFLFSLENQTGSGKDIKLRRLVLQMDATSALAAVMPLFKTSRTTGLPSGGTALTKVPFDTANTSVSGVVARGATASDGGAATAITATSGATAWQQFAMRLHTAVGQVLALDNNLLTVLVENNDFVLKPGEGIVVECVAAAGTSNPSTNHYMVMCAWEEV
jgi:hypothetical protein